MKISFEQFKKEVYELDVLIKEHFKVQETKERLLISDGVVNLREYYDSPIKIMWILKEPYCDGNNGGGSWSMTEGLNNERALGKKPDSQGTWHPIIYTTYGILNNFIEYQKIPKIRDNKDLSLVLRKIAFVNIQKLPAKKRTNDRQLKENFIKKGNDIVLIKQINTYRPDIVIGGKTLHLLKRSIGIAKNQELGFGHFFKDKTLFINTYHPAQTKVTRDVYVNKILERTKQWRNIYSS
jgi:hypothetical protein